MAQHEKYNAVFSFELALKFIKVNGFGLDDFGRNDFGLDDFGRDDFGLANFGRDDFGLANFERADFGHDGWAIRNLQLDFRRVNIFAERGFAVENGDLQINIDVDKFLSSRRAQSKAFVVNDAAFPTISGPKPIATLMIHARAEIGHCAFDSGHAPNLKR